MYTTRSNSLQVPDMCSVPSATSFSREIQSPTVNAAGFSMTAYRFQQSCTTVIASATGTSTTAIWPVMGKSTVGGTVVTDPAYASMALNYLDTRTVACGVRVQCNLPALTAQGFIHMAVVPEDMANSTTWSYPTSFAAMERAPYYQKVPLANLINNTPVISMPIMDEGAWRYRNTQLAPSQVGQQAIQAVPGSGNVQVTVNGTQTVNSGSGSFAFPFPFVSSPTIQVGPTVNTVGAIFGLEANATATTYSIFAEVQTGGTTGTPSSVAVNYEATGPMTYANASAYYASIGQAMPLSAANTASFTVPSIETTYGWGAVIIALENTGSEGTSPIEVEIIRHYEAIPSDIAGTVVTATRAQPNVPEILSLAKNVQQEGGCIDIVPSDKLGEDKPSFIKLVQKCASWTAGVTAAMSGFHPALSVVSGIASSIAGVGPFIIHTTYLNST